MSKKKNLVFLSLDPGSSGMRIASDAGDVRVSAHVAYRGGDVFGDDTGTGVGVGRKKAPVLIEHASMRPMYVGDTAAFYGRVVENIALDRQTGTPAMRAVLYSALTEHIKQHGSFDAKADEAHVHGLIPLVLGVALPNQLLLGNDATNTKKAVRAWLEGLHEWKADGRAHRAYVAHVVVTSQAVSAMFDYLLDDTGQFFNGRSAKFKAGQVGVLSLGFGTVEGAVLSRGDIVPDATKGADIGIAELLRDEYPNQNLAELEPDLRKGFLRLSASARETYAQSLWSWVSRQLWRGERWRNMDVVYVVGGGVHLVGKDLSKKVSSATLAEEPVLAVSRGQHKLLRREREKITQVVMANLGGIEGADGW